jgi:hypothetical protein
MERLQGLAEPGDETEVCISQYMLCCRTIPLKLLRLKQSLGGVEGEDGVEED